MAEQGNSKLDEPVSHKGPSSEADENGNKPNYPNPDSVLSEQEIVRLQTEPSSVYSLSGLEYGSCQSRDIKFNATLHISQKCASYTDISAFQYSVLCTDPSSNASTGLSTKSGLSESDLVGSESKVDSSLATSTEYGQNEIDGAHTRSFKRRLKNILFRLPFQPKAITVQALHWFGNSGNSSASNQPTPAGQHRVKFSPEVLQQYDAKGDVAGKERMVKRAAKKKSSAPKKVLDDDGRVIYNPSDSNRCKKHYYAEATGSVRTLSMNYRVQVDNFKDSLEKAGYYLEGNTKSIDGAADQFRIPVKHPMTSTVNNLAAKVWLFTHALQTIFETEEKPTKSEFMYLLKQFQLLGNECENTCAQMRVFESQLRDFDRNFLQHVLKTASRFNMKLNTEIHRVKVASNQQKILELSHRNVPEENLAIQFRGDFNKDESSWCSFSNFALHFKMKALLALIDEVLRSVQVVQAQMRFLLEDIVNGRFEAEDRHIFKILELMDQVISFFLNSAETSAAHEKNLRQVVRTFAKDSIDFLETIHFTIWKVFELRDTVHLCFAYITRTYKNTSKFEDYHPAAIYAVADSKILCCGNFKYKRFHFQPEDFYRSDFWRTLQFFYISSSKCQFMLKYSPKIPPDLNIVFSSSEVEDDEETLGLMRHVFSVSSYHYDLETVKENDSILTMSSERSLSDHSSHSD